MMTFQEVILTLEKFWADRGCVIQQPYDLEVGAGTFHPATFLRSLGPDPWKVGYVQPSRRPTDGRYGENSDPVDFYNEINVGRIPWSDFETVQHICEKSVEFEKNNDPSFKNNILAGPAAIAS